MNGLPVNTTSERPPLSRRMYALLALGFLAFVVYGSLVPFHWHALTSAEAAARWREVCARPVHVDSLSDWVTNVLLFVPVGYLAMAVGCVDRPRFVGLAAGPAVLAFCVAFSVSVEFTQLFFPPRCSSLNDVTANTLGSAAGISTWLALGQPLTGWLRRTWILLAERGLSAQLLPGYLLLLFLISAMPLDLTIRPADLYHKYKQGRVHLVPFAADLANPEQFVRKTIWTAILFLPVGVLLARLPGPGWRNRTRLASRPRGRFGGGRLGGVRAIVRLFATTARAATSSSARWPLSPAGEPISPGTVALSMRRARHGTRSGCCRTARWLLLAVWLAILAFLNWQPFDIIANPSEVLHRLHQMPLVPFADYQATAASHAYEQCLHKVVVFLPLGALLAWALGVANRTHSAIPTVLTGGLLALGLEAGQLFLQSRYASVTDVLIETGGVWMGSLIVRQLGNRSLTAPQESANGYCRG